MPLRRGHRVGFVGVLALAAAILGGAVWKLGPHRHHGRAQVPAAIAVNAGSPLPVVVDGIRRGDVGALALLHRRLGAESKVAAAGVEAPDWLDAMLAIRANFRKYSPRYKIAAVESVSRIVAKFAVESTPAGWAKVLPPAHDVLTGAVDDPDDGVSAAALAEIGRLWTWIPGCSMNLAEERDVGQWKEALHVKVVSRLAYPATRVRMAAIACLGMLPIDDAAAPAVGYIRDKDWSIRFQVLQSFANRPALLDVDSLLPLLYDPMPDLASLTERVLRGRGLTQEEIGLGRLVYHPRPDLRASAIPLLLRRQDVDPVNVLLHLTNDGDASVRLQAVEACAGRGAPEVIERLREMAAGDASPEVRAAALKLAPAETTAALPPLPGSPSLNPRAN